MHVVPNTYHMYPLHAIPCKPTTAFAKPFFFHFSRLHPSCRRFPSSGHSNMSLSCNTIWLGLHGFTSFSPRVGYITYFFRLRSRRRAIFQTVSYTSGHTRFSTSLQIATVIFFLLPSCWNLCVLRPVQRLPATGTQPFASLLLTFARLLCDGIPRCGNLYGLHT